MPITTTVQGENIRHADGSLASGTIGFTPTAALHDAAGNVVVTRRTVITAVVGGVIADVDLYANTDPDVLPTGTGYRVTERLDGVTRVWETVIPHTAATIDYADLTPATVTELFTYAPAAHAHDLGDLGDVDTAGAAELDLLGFDGAGWVPTTPGAAAHPDAATHDAMGLATDAEVATVVGNHDVSGTAHDDIRQAVVDATSTLEAADAAEATTRANADAALQTAIDGKQASDADLTAIAALTTTAFGRALLELANAGAARTALGLGTAALAATGDFDAAGAAAAAQAASQPADSDLTAIAALTTTAYGRSLLEAANAAGARTLLGLGTAAEKNTGTADGEVALLSTGGRFPIARIASGTPDGTKFVRDDGTLAAPAGGGAESWYHMLDPAAPTRNTNWSNLDHGSNHYRFLGVQSGGAVGDKIEWDVYLSVGTWDFVLLHTGSTNRPIVTVSIGGTSIGTLDLYNAVTNSRTKATITGVSVASAGKKTLKIEVTDKNASSSNYFGMLSAVDLVRTA